MQLNTAQPLQYIQPGRLRWSEARWRRMMLEHRPQVAHVGENGTADDDNVMIDFLAMAQYYPAQQNWRIASKESSSAPSAAVFPSFVDDLHKKMVVFQRHQWANDVTGRGLMPMEALSVTTDAVRTALPFNATGQSMGITSLQGKHPPSVV